MYCILPPATTTHHLVTSMPTTRSATAALSTGAAKKRPLVSSPFHNTQDSHRYFSIARFPTQEMWRSVEMATSIWPGNGQSCFYGLLRSYACHTHWKAWQSQRSPRASWKRFATSLTISLPSACPDNGSVRMGHHSCFILAAGLLFHGENHLYVSNRRSCGKRVLTFIKLEINLDDQYTGRTKHDYNRLVKKKDLKNTFDGLHVSFSLLKVALALLTFFQARKS